MSLDKSGSSSKSSTNQASNSTATPNNLAALQTGWNTASDLLSSTNGNSAANANSALSLINSGANAASGAATGGLTTATGLANGGTANAANQYLTPFANGSMTGNNNPYFANLTQQLSQALQGQTDGGFAAAGRYGSGANANAFNSALANETGQLGYANYNQSLQNQLNAGNQLSTNSANSTNAALAALGAIPGLGTAATGAGAAGYAGATAPTNTYANILQLLGAGGSTTSGNVNTNTTGSTSGYDASGNLGLGSGGAVNPGSLLSVLGL